MDVWSPKAMSGRRAGITGCAQVHCTAGPLPRHPGILSFRSRISSQSAALRRPAQVARGLHHRTGSAGRVASVVSSASSTWEATITSTQPSLIDASAGTNLELIVLDGDSDALSAPIALDSWQKVPRGGPGAWARKGSLALPAGLRPAAVLITKLAPAGATVPSLDYISSLKLKGENGVELLFIANSYVSSDHGPRVFFEATPCLPQNTPKPILAERERELAILRGEMGGFKKPSDRAYTYQVYDDHSNAAGQRPVLGGADANGEVKYPYPRHLGNLKPEGTTGSGKPVVPFDEEFTFTKDQGYRTMVLMAGLKIGGMLQATKLATAKSWTSFQQVYDTFREGGWPIPLDEGFLGMLVDKFNMAPTPPGKLNIAGYTANRLSQDLKDAMARNGNVNIAYKTPLGIKGRLDAWDSDEELGRQFLAGHNPHNIEALKRMPEEFGSAISSKHVDAEIKALGGSNMKVLVRAAAAGGKPSLYMVDLWWLNNVWGDKTEENPGTFAEHAGRVVFYLDKVGSKDAALIPLAIELKHRGTQAQEKAEGRELPATAGVVYSRQELAHNPATKPLWSLAKMVVRSMHGTHHQIAMHWLRAHACAEPFVIAIRRCFSAAHPVYKLMHPHGRGNLDVNARGRVNLTPAAGFLETCVTPGMDCMAQNSKLYGDTWRFRKQAFPVDLKERGMVDSQGKPWLDYPLADDGLDFWYALETYFSEYLRLYYKSDADVAADGELQRFWEECKNEGHPDIKHFEPDEAKSWGFAGPVATIDQLVYVMTTIAWIKTGLHGSVNFLQWDYSPVGLNTPCAMSRRIPRPSDTEAVKALADGGEAELLSYMTDPKTQLKALHTIMQIATHSEDEELIDMPNQLITDPAAVAANAKFIASMKALEATIEARNRDPARFTRAGKNGVVYTAFLPSSPPGLTLRGVPYSITV